MSEKSRGGPVGYVIFAHGSPIESANQAVREIAAQAAGAGKFALYETAFLDSSPPTLADAVKSLAGRGASEIVVIPYFLTLGMHLQRDLPALVKAIEAGAPGVKVSVMPPLDGHAALSGILVDRAREAGY